MQEVVSRRVKGTKCSHFIRERCIVKLTTTQDEHILQDTVVQDNFLFPNTPSCSYTTHTDVRCITQVTWKPPPVCQRQDSWIHPCVENPLCGALSSALTLSLTNCISAFHWHNIGKFMKLFCQGFIFIFSAAL